MPVETSLTTCLLGRGLTMAAGMDMYLFPRSHCGTPCRCPSLSFRQECPEHTWGMHSRTDGPPFFGPFVFRLHRYNDSQGCRGAGSQPFVFRGRHTLFHNITPAYPFLRFSECSLRLVLLFLCMQCQSSRALVIDDDSEHVSTIIRQNEASQTQSLLLCRGQESGGLVDRGAICIPILTGAFRPGPGPVA